MESCDTTTPFERLGALGALSAPALFRVSAILGRQRKVAERRFLATLVEIERRGILATRRAYPTIHDYARRVGGVAGEVVTEVLRLGRAYAAYPESWHLFASGRVGWTQLRAVVTVLPSKRDREWVELLTTASKQVLERLVREWKGAARLPGKPDTEPRPTPRENPAPWPFASGSGDREAKTSERPTAPRETVGRVLLAGAPEGALPGPVLPDPSADHVVVSPALRSRLEARRIALEARLGHPLDLETFLATLLDATEPQPRETPAVPARVLPGQVEAGTVTVLFREAERGRIFRQTRSGPREVPQAEALVRLREHEATPYDAAALEADAISSATRAKGFEPPPRVERWVWLRSGGACETPGCGARGRHLHHLTRRAERVDHHPDRIRLCCTSCHEALHAGLLDVEGNWLPLDRQPKLGWTDHAIQTYRRAAREELG